MSFGKLYGEAANPRTLPCIIVAKENGLDVELVPTTPFDEEFKKINPIGRIPAFVGANGFTLTETIAISIFLASQNEKTTLLGKTKQDYASILKWMSFSNSQVLTSLAGWFRPLIGTLPYNKKSVEDSSKATLEAFDVLEKYLHTTTYLVGDRITLADIFSAALCTRAFEYTLGKEWRAAHPAVTRWYATITNQPLFKATYEVPYTDEPLKNVPPKKEAKPKEPKEPKEALPKAEVPEEKPAPKPKHPLALLPEPSMNLDEWKRMYSNNDTRPVALPWFWEHYKPEEYSLWRIDYKYNEELKLTFMSNNLIGGLFARLEASRKYMFGSASVYGVNYDNAIQGAFIVRGQEAAPGFEVAPDWESYSLVKLDPSKPEDRKFVDDQWAWDTNITVNGKVYEWYDGRVYK